MEKQRNIGRVSKEVPSGASASAGRAKNGKGGDSLSKRKSRSSSAVGISKRELMAQSLRALAFGVFSLLLGTREMLFSTTPLALALLSAAGGETPYIFLGAILSSFAGASFSPQRLLGACLIVFLRLITKIFIEKNEEKTQKNDINWKNIGIFGLFSKLFSEHPYLRTMSAAIGGFTVGLWNIVAGGFRFYDLFGTIFYIVLTPVATLIFSKYFTITAKKREMGRAFALTPTEERFYLASCALLLSSLVFALGDLSAAGISVSLLIGVLATLYFCKRGALYGTAAGLVLGISCSLSYAPMLALCALSYSSLYKLSRFGAGVAACISGLIWGIYAEGFSALGTVFPSLLASTMIFCVADRIGFFEDVRRFFESAEERVAFTAPRASELIAEQRAATQEERLRAISDSFSALSEIFYNLSSKLKRPTALDLKRICEDSFDGICEGCENRDICYGAEYGATLDVMKRMTVQLHAVGTVEEKKLPEAFIKRCGRAGELVKEVNRACGIATKKALRNEKTEIFALDYDAISKILNDAISENEEEFKGDTALAKRIARVIADGGYGEKDVLVWGKRKLKILARSLDLSDKAEDVSNLIEEIEGVCEVSLSEPIFELGFGSVNMYTEAKRAFSAKSAFAVSASKAEKVCGDTVSIFENKNDYLYALISDGMGTGKRAAFASETCNVFLRNMLDAGNRMETSLRMLNSVLRAEGVRSELECSATVDLLQLDLYSGMLTLYKSGAAPTFVIRRGNVFKLTSQSFPIGILRSIDAKQIELACEDGDVIIMVSDGAMGQGEELSYLTDMLKDPALADEEPQRIAERIVRRARAESDIPDDDLSVVAVRVKKELYKW